MRTLTIIIALLFCANIADAQKRKVTTAYSFFTQEKLDRAKEMIDEALQHPDAVDFAKGYSVKGQIYQAIYESKDEAVKALAPDALNVAWEAYQKAMELDEKDKLKKEIAPQLANLVFDFINQGVTEYNNNDYLASLNAFKKAMAVHESPYGDQKVDTMVIHYAGITANQSGLYDEALGYFKRSLELNYDDVGTTYSVIVGILQRQGMEAQAAGNEALSAAKKEEAIRWIEDGINKFPDNEYLLVEIINYYLMGENPESAEQYLDKAIAMKPDHAQYYRAKGTLYEKLERSDDAEAMFKKTLELDPNDFTSYYQLGNIYLNKVIIEHGKANDIDDNKKFEAAINKVMSDYEAVLPYFEKARELDPEDTNTITTLSRLYFQLRTRPKNGAEYQKKYDAMQKLLGVESAE